MFPSCFQCSLPAVMAMFVCGRCSVESVAECFEVSATPSTVWPSIRTSCTLAATTSLSLFGTFITCLDANTVFNTQHFRHCIYSQLILHGFAWKMQICKVLCTAVYSQPLPPAITSDYLPIVKNPLITDTRVKKHTWVVEELAYGFATS